MKRTTLLISCIVFCFSCETNTTSSGGELVPLGAERITYEDSEVSYVYSQVDGNTLQEGNEVDGQKHGAWLTYDDKGSISALTTYHYGKKEGITIAFDKQGYPSVKSNYHHDQLSGDYRVFKRGKVIETRNYIDGQLEGPVKKYYESGKMLEESNYRNGQLDGIAKWYDQQGELTIAYRYENGELVDKNAVTEKTISVWFRLYQSFSLAD